MSNVSKRVVVTRTAEYSVPLPGYWDDLLSAIDWVRRELGDRAQYGDAARVRADDDRLVLEVELGREAERPAGPQS